MIVSVDLAHVSDSIYAHSGLPPSPALRAFKERHRRNPRGMIATGLGLVTLLCALLGLAYNGLALILGLHGAFDEVAREYQLTHFDAAFYSMSAICVGCYLVLLCGSCQLIRRRFSAYHLLIGVWLFEIAYYLVVLGVSRIPDRSGIDAAMGAANGGLMVQFVILLPIWGPLVLLGLKRSQPRVTAGE